MEKEIIGGRMVLLSAVMAGYQVMVRTPDHGDMTISLAKPEPEAHRVAPPLYKGIDVAHGA